MTRKTYCGNLLWQSGLTLLAPVSNVVDTTDVSKGEPRCQAAIRIGDVNYWSIRRNVLGEMHHVTVRDVASAGRVAVWIKGPLCDSSVTGIRCLVDGKKYDVTAPIERVDIDPQ